MDLKLSDLKLLLTIPKITIELIITVSKEVYKLVKWICATVALAVALLAVAIGIKKRRKE